MARACVACWFRSAVLNHAAVGDIGGKDKTADIPNRDSADYRIDEANLFR